MEKHSGHKKAHKKSKKHSGKVKIKKLVLWQGISAILGILLIASLFLGKGGSTSEADILPTEEVGENTVDFIKTVLGQQKAELKTAELSSIVEENNMYKVEIAVQGQNYPLYVSTDGDLLFLQLPLNIKQMLADIDEAVNEAIS